MQDYSSDPLLALIKERGLLDDLQLEEVLQEQTRTGKSISEILSDFGLVDVDTQLQVMADYLGTEVVNLDAIQFTPELLKNVPAGTARMYQCVPIEDFGTAVRIAMANPLNPAAIDDSLVGQERRVVGCVPKKQIRRKLRLLADRTA